MTSLLLIDDDRLILTILTDELTQAGYQVESVESVDEAETWLEVNNKPDLVILDVRMPERSGLDITKCLVELRIPFILLTAYIEPDIIKRATEAGAATYIVKPIDTAELIPAIETALSGAHKLKNLRGENCHLQAALDADRAVSIAAGIIMEQNRLSHIEALELLRKTARSQQIKLFELASKIVNAREVLNLKVGA